LERPANLSARLRVSTDALVIDLRWRRALRVVHHIIDRGREFLHARARDNDGIAATMRFLGDAEEFATVVLAEFHVKVFAFDLQFPGLYEVIHFFAKNGGV
jgi:hypothetical protein